MRILSVDPGYDRLGIAVLDGPTGNETLVYSDCIQTSPKEAHSSRLGAIRTAVSKVVEEYTPDALAIEALYFNQNQKTAIKVAEARGVVLAEAAVAGMNVHEFTPGQIKVAVTGYGKSDKNQVTEMTKKLVRVPKKGMYDDEYDAIAIGITAIASLAGV